jgi:polyhydroxybutyrate depolymerase
MTRFEARKQREKESRRTGSRRLAWIVACILLFISIFGITMYTQSLESKVRTLEKELLTIKRPLPSTCKVNGTWEPNSTTTRAINGRNYLVHVPEGFVGYQYYPLVMFYPGKGGPAETAQQNFKLDTLPAITVYPFPTMSKDGAWAWQGAPYSSNADDVSFTEAILDSLNVDLCVDKTRVYAVGYSNGGGFASLLSCTLSDRFAAYAVVAGAMYAPASQCKPSEPTPLISIHGDNDPVVPYEGSLKRQLPSIDTWSATRADLNGCKKPFTVNSLATETVTIWNDCKDNATVENIRLIGGGHAWGPGTNQILWQFLSRFSL